MYLEDKRQYVNALFKCLPLETTTAHTHTHSHTHTEGCDALIVAYEDERYVVVAGTFKKLVEQLACEEKPGET